MTEFTDADLRGSAFRNVDLSGSQFREVAFNRSTMRGVELGHVTIDGDIEDLVINGVDVGPLIEAELDRRDPDRIRMRPTTPAGFREAWDVLDRLWAGTIAKARALPPEMLHESVDDEWSFIETLRHLAFATESWVGRAILGDPSPWDPLSLPWDGMPDTPGVPRDRSARPSLDTVLALRQSRTAMVRKVLDELTDETLAADTTPVPGPGWPEPRSYPVKMCLSVVLNEEYQHRLFAERDLAELTGRTG
jgi:DinB superfamily/Pentapeptide repeats (8 copies)